VQKLLTIYHHASPEIKQRLHLLTGILLLLNIGVWVVTFLFAKQYHTLLGLVAISYGLGLRHAVDADHIAAIDNSTRKLMQDGHKPVAVGFFFSLGHSTIVILLSIILALSSSLVQTRLPAFKETGELIGTAVSSFFLLFIGMINLVIFLDIIKIWRQVTKKKSISASTAHEHMHVHGILARIFKPFMKTITKSWHMYPLGFLFGLGFDTASEVGILSISAASGAGGLMPWWLIMLLPLAFTAGMALIDSLDGVLMLGAYGWAYVKPLRKLYYNLNITFMSVIIALGIGGIETIQLFVEKFHLRGGLFSLIKNLDFGSLGYVIIGLFILSWLGSILLYRYKRYDLLDIEVHTHKEGHEKKLKKKS
jgi:high-affinity nickel-transport protein